MQYECFCSHNKKGGYMCRALVSEELDLIVQFACFFLLFLSSHSRDKVRRLFFQNIGVIGGWIV